MTDLQSLPVRQLQDADAETFRRVRLEALEREPLAFRATYRDEAGLPLASFRDRLVSGLVFGAFAGDALVATAGIDALKDDPAIGVLWGVYVRHDRRGQGLAQSVIKKAMAAAETRYGEIRLRVKATNAAARAAYARLGFRVMSRETAVAADGRPHEYEWWLRSTVGR